MEFYDFLSEYYDYVFPVSKEVVNFLKSYVNSEAKVLDLGAGTGEELIALAPFVKEIEGIELDEKMVIKGRKKIEGLKNNNLRLAAGDMRKLDHLKNNSYKMIYCIGNTLVHLDNLSEMEQVFKSIYELLMPSGCFVMQIVNYDRILTKHVKALPDIVNAEQGIVFHRLYSEEQNKIMFKGIIEYKGDTIGSSIVPLYPLLHEEIATLAENTKFEISAHFGSFNKDNYSENSMANIYVFTKR